MKRLLCLCFVACGSSTPTATTRIVDPVPMNEGSGSAAQPTPAEPTKPAEPPPPAAPDPAQVKAELLAAETAAYEKAKPVFDKWCAKCHSKDGAKTSVGKREHFDMTAYPFGGHHAMDVHNEVRIVLGLTGKKPTMPADKKGAVKGEELELIKAWADAFEASHKGGAHEGHGEQGGVHKH
jgi:cytochrome c5